MAGKIADSLIRVAATRIFADPKQAFMEVPVNSLDSYNRMEGKPPVGKFGMGFFSLFYWLVGRPDLQVVVNSCYRDRDGRLCAWQCAVREVAGKLTLEMQAPGRRHTTGTIIKVGTSYMYPNVQEWMSRLDHTDLSVRQVRTKKNLDELMKVARVPPAKPFYFLQGKSDVTFADQAEGISLETLFGSLLIPSVSTKGIAAAPFDESTAGFKVAEPLDEYTGSSLEICVNRIVVVEVTSDFRGKRHTIFLPQGVAVPVSRDAILFKKGDATYKLLARLLVEAALQAPFPGLLISLLGSYAQTDETKALLGTVQKRLYRARDILWLPASDVWKEVTVPGYRLVSGQGGPIAKSEKVVYDSFASVGLDDMFQGKRVVLIKTLGKITSGGYASLLFTPTLDVAAIVSSYMDERLTIGRGPAGTLTSDKLFATVRAALEGGQILHYGNVVTTERYIHNIKMVLKKITSSVMNSAESKALHREYLAKMYAEMCAFKYEQSYGAKPTARITPLCYLSASVVGADASRYMRAMDSVGEGIMTPFDKQGILYLLEHKIVEVPYQGMWVGQYLSLFKNPGAALAQFQAECAPISRGYLDVFFVASLLSRLFLSKALPAGLAGATMRYMQSKYTSVELEKYSKRIYDGANVVLKPMAGFVRAFTRARKVELAPSPDMRGAAVFRCSQLMEYLYANEAPSEALDWVAGAAEHRATGGTASQALGIAINEGTAKPYVQAVLTELSQNSLDAIRKTGAESKISIFASEDGFSFADYVGIPDAGLLSLLVPFLSTKVGDAASTGEMGTGFFNVYRQPYCAHVEIQTSNGERSVSITATPIVERGRAVDLEYRVAVRPGRVARGTRVTVKFREPSISLKIDVELYAHQLIAPLDVAKITLNTETINAKKKLVYRNEAGSVYYSADHGFTSLVCTSGVPVAELTAVKELGQYGESVRAELSNGILVDVNKGYYTPVQSRDKFLVADEHRMMVWRLLRCGIYNTLNERYCNEYADIGHYFVPHSSSSADFRQVIPMTVLNVPVEHQVSEVLSAKPDPTNDSLGELLSRVAATPGVETLDQAARVMRAAAEQTPGYDSKISPAAYAMRTAIFWLRNKKIKKSEDPELSPGRSGSPDRTPDATLPDLYVSFVKLFWEFGRELEAAGRIEGTKFRSHADAPEVALGELPAGVNGQYSLNKHTITILPSEVPPTLDEEWAALRASYGADPVGTVARMREDKVVWGQIGLSKHTSVLLVHELTHAWTGTDHSGHGHINLRIGDGKSASLPYEYAANAVYSFFLQNGFLARLLASS